MADEIQSTFTLDIEDLVAKLNEAASHMEETSKHMEEGFAGVGEAVESMQGMLQTAFEVTGAAIAYEAIEKLVDVFKEGAEQATQMEHASMRLGITVSEYQGLELAADQAGVGMDRLTRAGVMLDAKLTSAREGNERMAAMFKAAGVSAAELADKNYRGADALVTFGQNADKTAVQTQLVGVRNSEVMAVLPLLAGGFDELADAAARHGAISAEQAEKLHELHAAFAVAEFETKNYKLALLSELAPAIETLIGWYQVMAKEVKKLSGFFLEQAKPVLQEVWDGFKTLGEIFTDNIELVGVLKQAWKTLLGDYTAGEFVIRAIVELFAFMAKAALEGGEVFYEFGRTVQQMGEKLAVSLASLSITASKAFHLDFSGAIAEWQAGTQELVGIDKKAEDDIVKSRAAMQQKLLQIDLAVELPEFDEKGAPDRGGARDDKKGDIPKLGKKKDDPELELLQFQMEQAEKGSEEKVALAKLVSERMIAIGEGTVKAAIGATKVILAAEKEQHAEEERLAMEGAKAEHDEIDESLKYSQKVLDEDYKAHKISADQYVTLSQTVADAKLKAEDDYITKMEDLADGNLEKIKKLEAERLKVHMQTEEAMAQISARAAMDVEKSWEKITGPMTKAMGDMFVHMGKDHQKFNQAFRGMANQMLGDMEKGILTMVEKWAAGELAKQLATEASVLARTLAEQGGVGQMLATMIEGAMKFIGIESAKGAAGAAAATADIPYVGPFLAPIEAASTAALIMGYASSVAEQGYDIPYGENPVTQLHQEEMVLPKRHADVIRSLADGGGAGGGGATHNHNYAVNIQALDSRSVERMFSTNGRHLVKALHEQVRNFNTPVHGKK